MLVSRRQAMMAMAAPVLIGTLGAAVAGHTRNRDSDEWEVINIPPEDLESEWKDAATYWNCDDDIKQPDGSIHVPLWRRYGKFIHRYKFFTHDKTMPIVFSVNKLTDVYFDMISGKRELMEYYNNRPDAKYIRKVHFKCKAKHIDILYIFYEDREYGMGNRPILTRRTIHCVRDDDGSSRYVIFSGGVKIVTY